MSKSALQSDLSTLKKRYARIDGLAKALRALGCDVKVLMSDTLQGRISLDGDLDSVDTKLTEYNRHFQASVQGAYWIFWIEI